MWAQEEYGNKASAHGRIKNVTDILQAWPEDQRLSKQGADLVTHNPLKELLLLVLWPSHPGHTGVSLETRAEVTRAGQVFSWWLEG